MLEALGSGSELAKGLRRILDSELSMPNIPTKTMGGHVFWNTLASGGGYKLQQNIVTQHARILDDEDRRIAWGSFGEMTRAMDSMVKYLHDKKKSDAVDKLDAMQQLKALKELLDTGAITQEEFDIRKAELMKRI